MPAICILCNQFHQSKIAVCKECIDLMPLLGPKCQYCACPLYDDSYLVCGQCIKKRPYFDQAIIHYTFEEPLRGLLHQFKYYNALYLTSFLSHLMINSLSHTTLNAQCLIPVPLHPQKLKARGFNQAALLAKKLGKKLNIPYDLTSCKKIINTAPQASLDGEQRQKNLRNAFKVQTIPYQYVIIIDDLLTTGSTANELARSLKQKGVQQVDIWCCARTLAKE